MQPQSINKEIQNIFYIDSHTHLLDYDRESHLQLSTILQQSSQQNIKYIAVNTCCSNQFNQLQKLYLSSQKVNIIPCFGIHPCYICEQLKQEKGDQWKKMLKQYLTNYPLSHIGQIGLDFRKDVIETNPKDKQWQFFQSQFQMAIQYKRSVTIHCVRAYGQILKYFKKINSKHTKEELDFPIVLHSYGGSKQITKSLLKLEKLNIYFSLSLKHSKQILQILPLQKIILQTDAPYQNDHQILLNHNFTTQEKLKQQENTYQKRLQQNKPTKQLLKQCIFFNKSILDNRPINLIANYKEVAKTLKIQENLFINKITQNALKAFKILK